MPNDYVEDYEAVTGEKPVEAKVVEAPQPKKAKGAKTEVETA